MRLIIAKTGDSQIVSFATSELCRLLKEMDSTIVLDVRKYKTYDENVKNTVWVGTDFVQPDENDTIHIDVKNSVGFISGSNERSVLIAVYRFMYELGCRYLYPGKTGEKIPKKKLYYDMLTVSVNETASYKYRGICIEGSTGYEHIVNTIDWLPKVGMNEYFTQFVTPGEFVRRYYDNFYHDKNDLHYGNEMTNDEVDAIMEVVKEEIAKRGINHHTGGHIWTGKAMGVQATGWEETDCELDTETVELLAEINGKRGIRSCAADTNLCYSNPKARTRIADSVVEFAEEHPEYKALHFYFADHANNHCECDACRKKIVTDYYVMMLNEIDKKLTDKSIDTKIVVAAYNELMFAPQTEKIKNPDRIILDFAPISRSYSHSYADLDMEKEFELEPFVLNQFKGEEDLGKNVARLKEWQKQNVKDSFLFDYHLMWDHHTDPGYYYVAKTLHEDVKNIERLGLNGMISCQLLRVALPTGLPQYGMACALWNKQSKFLDVEKEYFEAAFGENAENVKNYLATLSDLFDPEFIRLEKEKDKQTVLADMTKIKEIVSDFEKKYIRIHENESPDWQYLKVHAKLCVFLADIYIARYNDDREAEEKIHTELVQYVRGESREITDSVLDEKFIAGNFWHYYHKHNTDEVFEW
ncbi:MAG: DUF4838 domain-containing protein [Clostridia bacterium]|nr:DUF4838 domain-containing protein [Clostridia bacterium]